MIVYTNSPGHMTKIAAMSMYCKKSLQNLLRWNQKTNGIGPCLQHLGDGLTKFVQKMVQRLHC